MTKIDYHKFYSCYGLQLEPGDDQMTGICPFCDKEGKLYVSPKTGQGDCKSCGEAFNNWSFLSRLIEFSPLEVDPLAENRNISSDTLTWAGVCLSFLTGEYLLPSYAYGADGKIKLLNVYRAPMQANGKVEVRSGPSPCKQQPYLINHYNGQPTVCICEGHWDALLWVDVLARTSRRGSRFVRHSPRFDHSLLSEFAVVGAPGSNTWKEEWLTPLKKASEVILLYDNDEPGKKGVQRTAQMISSQKRWSPRIQIMEWKPEDKANDLRDLTKV